MHNYMRLIMRAGPLFNAPVAAITSRPPPRGATAAQRHADHLHGTTFGTDVQYSGGLPPPR